MYGGQSRASSVHHVIRCARRLCPLYDADRDGLIMMADAMSWTTPDDLCDQVLRVWERGKILSAGITGETLFPLKLSMRRPDAKAMGQSFDTVRGWIRKLEENSRSCKG